LGLIVVDAGLEAEALRWLRQSDEREYSSVDPTSFAVMRSWSMHEALAFDGGSTSPAAGFLELRS
jgi:predicted nucleic acid-binding protein